VDTSIVATATTNITTTQATSQVVPPLVSRHANTSHPRVLAQTKNAVLVIKSNYTVLLMLPLLNPTTTTTITIKTMLSHTQSVQWHYGKPQYHLHPSKSSADHTMASGDYGIPRVVHSPKNSSTAWVHPPRFCKSKSRTITCFARSRDCATRCQRWRWA